MPRIERFTFVCSKEERRLIALLAEQLQRLQSDAVRYVVLNAVKTMSGTVNKVTDSVGT